MDINIFQKDSKYGKMPKMKRKQTIVLGLNWTHCAFFSFFLFLWSLLHECTWYALPRVYFKKYHLTLLRSSFQDLWSFGWAHTLNSRLTNILEFGLNHLGNCIFFFKLDLLHGHVYPSSIPMGRTMLYPFSSYCQYIESIHHFWMSSPGHIIMLYSHLIPM